MSAWRDIARLMRDTADLRRLAEETSARHRLTLAEHRRILRRLRTDPLRPESTSFNAQAASDRPTGTTGTAREKDNLGRADRHISEGEARIETQRALIEQLHQDGHDTTRARELLAVFLRTLDAWHAHRNTIVAATRWHETYLPDRTGAVSPPLPASARDAPP